MVQSGSPQGGLARSGWPGLISSVCVTGLLILIMLIVLSGSSPSVSAAKGAQSVAAPAGGCAPTLGFTVTSNYAPMGMAYDSARNRLYVANRDGPDGGSLMMLISDFRLYLPFVANNYSATVTSLVAAPAGYQNAPGVVNGGGPSRTTKYLTGLPGVRSVAFDAGRNRLYAVSGGTLYIVNGATFTLQDTFTMITATETFQAFAVAYNPAADKIYVTDYDNNRLKIINAQTWTATNLYTGIWPLDEPAYIAVNPGTNRVYVANHSRGLPQGFVTVISGLTDQIVLNIGLNSDLYGIAVDTVHNWVFATSISDAKVFGLNGADNQPLTPAYRQLVHTGNGKKVPLRQVAVNPSVDSALHLWLTASSDDTGADLDPLDGVILMAGANWSAMSNPVVLPVGQFPKDGLIVDPATWNVFVSSSGDNVVTGLQDNAVLCPSPLRPGLPDDIVLMPY
jgi:DNA-binding beta-propeller fold protein YncE